MRLRAAEFNTESLSASALVPEGDPRCGKQETDQRHIEWHGRHRITVKRHSRHIYFPTAFVPAFIPRTTASSGAIRSDQLCEFPHPKRATPCLKFLETTRSRSPHLL